MPLISLTTFSDGITRLTAAIMRRIEGTIVGLQYNVQDADYGATGDGTTGDTIAIQAAIDAAEAAGGGTVFFPAGTYKITSRLRIDSPNVHLTGVGTASKIRQATWGPPVFDVRASDVTIEKLYLYSTETRTNITTTVTDPNGDRVYCAGVYITGAHRTTVRRVRVSGLYIGVTARGNLDGTTYDEDLDIDHLLVDTVDWGVLFGHQKRPSIKHVKGTVLATTGNTDPVHLLYASEGSAAALNSVDGEVYACRAYSHLGHGFQFKNCQRFTVWDLSAYDTEGLLSIDDVTDSAFRNVKGTDLRSSSNASVLIQNSAGTCDRNTFNGFDVFQATGVNDRILAISTGTTGSDNTFANWIARCATPNAASYAVVVRGARQRLTGFDVTFLDALGRAVYIETGADHSISGIRTKNCQYTFQVNAGVTTAVLEYAPDMLGNSLGAVIDAGTGTINKARAYV